MSEAGNRVCETDGFHGRAWKCVAEEIWLLLQITVPMMFRLYILCAFDRLTVAIVGHYDSTPDHIAGALMGKTYSTITGLSVGIGIALGINTLASQNHGRGANHENGMVLWQCVKVLAGAFVFSAAAAILSKPLLSALGQPAGVLTPCQLFSTVQVMGLPATWLSSALGNILVSQGVVGPNVVCDASASMLSLMLSYVFMCFCGIGYIGAALATAISNWVQLALYLIYIVYTRRQDTVWRLASPPASDGCPGWRPLGFVSLRIFLQASLPSAFSLWAEWWAAEVLSVFAGWLPGAELSVAANGLLFNTLAVFYMTFVATQIATTTRVGNLIGKKDVCRVPMSIGLAVALAAVLSGLVALVLHVWGPQILQLYTDEVGIIREATRANLGMVLSVPPYATMMCLLGCLRGAGLQKWGALVLFVSFYVVGLPMSALLGLRCDMDLLGIWTGNVIALSLSALGMGLRVCCVNWASVIQKAAATAEGGAELVDPLRG